MIKVDPKAIANLPPKERVEAIRQLREEAKKELEEAEKRHKHDLEESEEMLRSSIEELTEEEEKEETTRLGKLRTQIEELQREERSLEETVRNEQAREGLEKNAGYRIPQEGGGPGQAYTPIGQIVDDLQNLYGRSEWSSQEADLYQQRKEELSHAVQYRNTMGEDLVEQLDTAQSMMKKLGYRH